MRRPPPRSDGRFATFFDGGGAPPCNPSDTCAVCVLFTGQRPGERRDEWLARITGIPQRTVHQEAS